jgi:large conductance mechanosensitive channel
MLKEFKEFAFKGNMIDLAVGMILGASFGTVVKSLVDDIVMPVIGKLINGLDFTNLLVRLDGVDEPITLKAAQESGVAVLKYGMFIQNFIVFLITAFAIFLIVKKLMGAMKKAEEKPAEEAPAGPTQEELLCEIRDLLKAK